MRRKYIEEDINVMDCVSACIKENQNPLNSTLTYGGNTTVINYKHLFQYAKLYLGSFTCAVDLAKKQGEKDAKRR